MIWPFNRRSRNKLARIEVSGAIAGGTRDRLLKAFKTVEEKRYPGLLLRIDSPGGTVGDSQEIYSALKRLQRHTKILASFGNISASGGVYIAMGCHHIVANPGSITGSIGVILRGNNLERLLDKVGVSFKVVKSGPYKDILAFDRELTEAEQDILQTLIDSSYQQFVSAVAGARGLSEDAVRDFADGRVFTGAQALDLGLVDRLGSEEEAKCWLAELVNLDPEKVEVTAIEAPKPFWNKLLPGQQSRSAPLALGLEQLQFDLATSGLPLWLYRP